MGKITKADWAVMETEYVTGSDSVTHKALSDKYGIRPAAIGKRAQREDWMRKRQGFRRNVSNDVIEKIKKYAIKSMVELNIQDLEILDSYVAKALRDIESGITTIPAGSVLTALLARRRIYQTIYGEEPIPDEVHEVAFKLVGVDVSKILALRDND